MFSGGRQVELVCLFLCLITDGRESLGVQRRKQVCVVLFACLFMDGRESVGVQLPLQIRS